VRSFKIGETVVRCDMHRSGRVWSEHVLRVVADTSEALVAACPPGAETRPVRQSPRRRRPVGANGGLEPLTK
jgi:hypothetical protein